MSTELVVVGPVDPEPEPVGPGQLAPEVIGRSPGQLAWLRLKRDRTAVASGSLLAFFLLVALAAPVIQWAYGHDPTRNDPTPLDDAGYPLGYLGGISGGHWLGVTPQFGRDVLMNLVFGLRTSLVVGATSAVLTTAIGVVVGIVAGYLGGRADALLNWVIDVVLAFPFLIFCLAMVPVVTNRFFTISEAVPPSFQIGVIVAVFTLFSWAYPARLIRGQVLSLREREFVEAARAAGASVGHIMFRQLLPNLWAPILVSFSLAVPAFITAEAALSFLNIGITEPTPDLGRLVYHSAQYRDTIPSYMIITGTTLFLVVLAFNLFGDALRDALDPRSAR